MPWVLLALAATLFWAFSNILDKILSTKFIKHPISLVASFGIFYAIFTIILVMGIGNPFSLPLQNLVAAFLAGLIVPYAIIPYVKSLSLEEASRVIPLFHFSAIFTLLLAVGFLNELLTPLKYGGFTAIFVGGMLIATKRVGSVFHLSPAIVFILLSSLIFSVSDVLLKFSYSSGIFLPTLSIFYMGVSAGSLSLFGIPEVREGISRAVSLYKGKVLMLVFFSALLGFSANFFWNNAILQGPVTLVGVFISFQSLFVLIMATVLASKFHLLKDEALDAKTIGMKIVAIALMMVGLFLLNF